jgi:hypothetical protein
MSEVLELAQQLRLLSDEELAALVRQRMINSTHLKDFFDLAESLLQPRNLETWIAGLTAKELESLAKAAGHKDPLMTFLASSDTFSSTLAEMTRTAAKQAAKAAPTAAEKRLDSNAAARDGGIRAFETSQAITEIIYDLEQRRIKLIGKAGIPIGELKRLGQHLGKSVEGVRETFEVAAATDLIANDGERWVLNSKSANWLDATLADRWGILTETWLAMVGESTRAELANLWSQAEGQSISSFLSEIYPFAEQGADSRFAKIERFAENIGLTSNGFANPWLAHVVANHLEMAKQSIKPHLPAEQQRIIVQGDLSIISPGPLGNTNERELRAFVETEQAGLASRYRISALSISQALESQVSATEIKATLERLSATPLPQPVDYLITDTVKRFGRIRVSVDLQRGGSMIEFDDPHLCTQLLNESSLKPFSLRSLDSQHLHSKYDADVMYFGLREIGQLAVRVDSAGKLVSPLKFGSRAAKAQTIDGLQEAIVRFRAADARVAHSGDDEAMLRQIQLALKNKANLRVAYLGKDGTEYEFLLEPVGVANGRLRARDRKADLERTLPLANIIRLELA